MKRVLAAAAACLMSTVSYAVEIYTKDNMLKIEGEILFTDDIFFRDILKRRADAGHPVAYVFLNSPGGNIAGATNIATILHDRGIKTLIPDDGACASACVIIFASGVERYAWAGFKLGVHGASTGIANEYGNEAESGDGTVEMAKWLAFYGAPAAVIAKMVVTSNTEMTWLTADDVAGWVAFINPNEPRREEQRQVERKPSDPGYGNTIYSMSCRSTATGNYYDVYWQHGFRAVAVGERSYTVDEYHVNHGKVGGVSTGRSAWVVSGTTHINTKYTAVFGGKRPRVEFYDGRTKETDLCN